jgi:hypothetical protein
MKSLFQKAILAITVVATIATINSCSRKKQEVTPQEPTAIKGYQEPNFHVKNSTEAGKLTRAFLKHTNYSLEQKQTRDGSYANLPSNQAAWTFEAASNFLTNSNVVRINLRETYPITMPRSSDSTIDAATLISSFNAFMGTLSGNSTKIPKLVNVKIDNETAAELKLLVDVDFGSDPSASVVYPTTNMAHDLAADWLENTFADQVGDILNYLPGQTCDGPGLFYYNVQTVGCLCYTFPLQTDLPDPWLWTASVANGNAQDAVFKAADFLNYYAKLLARKSIIEADALSISFYGYVNPVCIHINISGEHVGPGGAHPLMPSGSAASAIQGYVHAHQTATCAEIGCMPAGQ